MGKAKANEEILWFEELNIADAPWAVWQIAKKESLYVP